MKLLKLASASPRSPLFAVAVRRTPPIPKTP